MTSSMFSLGIATPFSPSTLRIIDLARLSTIIRELQSFDLGGVTLWSTYKKLWKDPPFSMGKSTINGIFSIAMFVYRRVTSKDWSKLRYLVGGGQPIHLEKWWSESQWLVDDIPYMKWKIIPPCSKPPTRYVNDLFILFFTQKMECWKIALPADHDLDPPTVGIRRSP